MSATSGLSVGDRVTLHSLKATALNGKKGVLTKFVENEGRWAVKVDDDKSGTLKTIKPENLKREATVGVVVIPTEGDMYYHNLPAHNLQDWSDSLQNLLEDRRSDRYYHYYWLPKREMGWMTMHMNDLFDSYPINRNMAALGWTGRQHTIQGTVVVSFATDASEVPYFNFEPYSFDIVKMLLVELREARTLGHPTRNRMAEGEYHQLPPMPRFRCYWPEEEKEAKK